MIHRKWWRRNKPRTQQRCFKNPKYGTLLPFLFGLPGMRILCAFDRAASALVLTTLCFETDPDHHKRTRFGVTNLIENDFDEGCGHVASPFPE
jgi:hypothetical protein